MIKKNGSDGKPVLDSGTILVLAGIAAGTIIFSLAILTPGNNRSNPTEASKEYDADQTACLESFLSENELGKGVVLKARSGESIPGILTILNSEKNLLGFDAELQLLTGRFESVSNVEGGDSVWIIQYILDGFERTEMLDTTQWIELPTCQLPVYISRILTPQK